MLYKNSKNWEFAKMWVGLISTSNSVWILTKTYFRVLMMCFFSLAPPSAKDLVDKYSGVGLQFKVKVSFLCVSKHQNIFWCCCTFLPLIIVCRFRKYKQKKRRCRSCEILYTYTKSKLKCWLKNFYLQIHCSLQAKILVLTNQKQHSV